MYESPVFRAYVYTHCYMCESAIQNTLSHVPPGIQHITVEVALTADFHIFSYSVHDGYFKT